MNMPEYHSTKKPTATHKAKIIISIIIAAACIKMTNIPKSLAQDQSKSGTDQSEFGTDQSEFNTDQNEFGTDQSEFGTLENENSETNKVKKIEKLTINKNITPENESGKKGIYYETPNFHVGVILSTLGIGPDAALYLNDYLRLRLIGGFVSFSSNLDVGGVTYEGSLHFNNVLFALEYVFFSSHIGLGVAINDNKLRLAFRPSLVDDSIQIGNGSYKTGASAEVVTNTVSPYISTGFGFKPFSFLSTGFDFGIVLHGKPRIANYQADDINVIAADIAEETRQINEQIGKFNIYPFISFNLLATF